ncbi:cubilin [Fopius arisanus]|uniref:Cubilin n=2 Tax=Fopius arisanus TaxID=64838 RepID=A0A9R1U0D4_9HYME|nr:PREDICTED: cubilin [Fopius arisanus]
MEHRVLRLLLFLILSSRQYSAWQNERPVLESVDGHLIIWSAQDKNVTIKTRGKGFLTINDLNLVESAHAATHAAQYVENWKRGSWQDLQNRVERLVHTVEGPDGLVRKLEGGWWRNTGNSSTSRPATRDSDMDLSTLNWRVNNLADKIKKIQTKLKNNKCANNPCLNGGTCIRVYDGYQCLCPTNWQGPSCGSDVNECGIYAGTDLGCQNGATCVNTLGSYTCSCTKGWFGVHCTSSKSACDAADSRELCGNGVCVDQKGTPLGYTCLCDQGWKSDGANPACIVDVDECAGKHPVCSVNPEVECINLRGSFHCGNCPAGYSGTGYFCRDIDECLVDNGGCSTVPKVHCRNVPGSRICGPCPPGYSGDGETCTYYGTCRINNGGCHHLATCIESTNSLVQCRCPAGYIGDGLGFNGCTISAVSNPCAMNPCIHGSCVQQGHSFICNCQSGYSGSHCEIAVNPCVPNPCRNSGICTRASDNTVTCECTATYQGPRCETPKRNCGGYLRDPSGTLSYPPDGGRDSQGRSCAFIFITNHSLVLNVTFTRFKFDSTPPACPNNFLQIHDGTGTSDHHIGRFCGTKLPSGGNIISTHNSLYIWSHVASVETDQGFTLHWNSIPPKCGGYLTSDHGAISSPGSPGKYPLNRDCQWEINVSPGRRIQFHFFTFQLESNTTCAKDYLQINETVGERQIQLQRYCGHMLPEPLFTSGSTAILYFHSDGDTQDQGFQIGYSTIEAYPGCGGIHTAPQGTISSPVVQGRYEAGLECTWKIQLPQGEKIRLVWQEIDIEDQKYCYYDFVEIYEGPDEESPVVGKYCGTNLPLPRTLTTNVAIIVFSTDSSFHGKGFTIKYDTHCGGEFHEPSGIFASPYYPSSYPDDKNCFYEIIQPPNKGIVLQITDLDIEGHWHSDCYFDHLDIYDGDSSNSTKLAELCGGEEKIPDTPFYSSNNYMYLEFQTDGSYSFRGFQANYSTVDRRCGGLLKNNSGSIVSPGGNDGYSENEECSWTIQAPIGHVIHLSWMLWSLEGNSRCRHDYVEITEQFNNEELLIGKYCGHTKPPEIITLGNIMNIAFKSDDTVHGDGFLGEYIFIDASKSCGGRYFSSVGVITTPEWPKRYAGGRDCVWIIEGPARSQIMLTVETFDLEVSNNCRFDHLEIRNGAHETSPLIGKYCGEDIPTVIRSFTNYLYLRFKSDDSLSAPGFRIEWDATQMGCGGTLTKSSEDIMSPNYPISTSSVSVCTWTISIARGNQIQIILVDIDFGERASRCTTEYLEISEGINGIVKNKQKYCSTENQSLIHLNSNDATLQYRTFFGNGRGFHIKYNTLCQNTLHAHSGVIESPNFPNRYPPNCNCTWIIDAPMGNKINISFSHFDLEPENPYTDSPCKFDYLEIKEGSYGSPVTELGRFCATEGMTLPPKIVSTENQVFITFRTDSESHFGGFRLEWVVNGCGGHIKKQQGTVTSPGYPNKYPTNIDCEWTIEVDYGYSVQINFTDVDTEKESSCMMDIIEVYGGVDESAPKLGEFCHSKTPILYVSPINSIFIKLHSDWNHAGRGFTANFAQVQRMCGGRIKASQGSIHSQNYPMNYPVNQNCEWLIEVGEHHLINLTFVDVDLEGSTDCIMDYIKVFDGPTREHNLLETFCGKTIPSPIISSGDSLLVVMRSDPAQTAKGFQADFQRACGARIVTNGTGFLTTASDLHLQHEDGLNCSWIISAENPADHITLTISHMDMNCRWGSCEDNCTSHYLKVYEGEGTDGPVNGQWCESKAPPPIVSSGNTLTIHLVTFYYSDVSFGATYSALDSACGGEYYAESGTLASPGYPKSYATNAECEWTLHTAAGNGITLTFSKFNIERSDNCDRDYLEIREDSSIGKIIGVYCGTEIGTVQSNKTLWMKFRSDEHGTAEGFVAEYTFNHGSELFGPFGVIASPLYPHAYTNYNPVTWRVTVQSGFSIKVEFDDFHIDNFGDLTCDEYQDGLQVFDGYDEDAPQLHNFCGSTSPEPFQTTSNVMFLMFQGGKQRLGNWFKIRYYEVPRTIDKEDNTLVHLSNCNEEIALMNDNNSYYTITSPGYPDGYNHSLHCNWLITSPPGTHLLFKLKDLNLEEGHDCYGDSVSVFDGIALSEEPPPDVHLLGKYCRSNESDSRVESITNTMTVKFLTDSFMNRTGFKAEVIRECGGQLGGPNGVINFNRTTRYQVMCDWNITVSRGKSIEVTIEDIQLPKRDAKGCGDDYVLLKNGQEVDSPFLGDGKYCSSNEEEHESLMTTGNKLYVKISAIALVAIVKISYREIGVECGGSYTLMEGINEVKVKTPGYPNVPPPYTECLWTFMAPAGRRLSLHFIDRFDLTSSAECQKEYVEVRDGGTDHALVLGVYCGRTAPSTISTKGNMLYIKYYTDMSVPGNGFNALVTDDEICGEVIRASTGIITSPNYPNPYPKGRDCAWWIIGPKYHSLRFEIIDLHLPGWRNCSLTDHMSIEGMLPNGTNDSRNEPHVLCGFRNVDNIIETLSNEAVITLTSTGKSLGNYRGFRLNFTSSMTQCGGELNSPEGSFHSFGYPTPTPARIYCLWKITVPLGGQVKLEILDLDLQTDNYVRFYNDFRSRSPIGSISSADRERIISSSSNKMMVAFVANEGYRGLSATFKSEPNPPCGGDINEQSGSLPTPSEEPYKSRSFYCLWTIRAPADMIRYDAPADVTLAVTVTGSLGNQVRPYRRCISASKYVAIKDASNNIIGAVCGNSEEQPGLLRSRSPLNYLEILNGTRWGAINVDVKYQWNRCGALLTGPSHTIRTPVNATFPRNCVWEAVFPEGQGIVMTLNKLNLKGCDKSYIIVKNGGPRSPEARKYCGNIIPNNFTSKSHKLWIEYYALEAPADFEFELNTIPADCRFSGYNISSPGFPRAYPNKSECVWEYDVEPGYHIGLSFIDRFSLENSINCTNDYVEVFDRERSDENTWKSLGKVCGRNTPSPFNTTTNHIKVIFHSNDDIRGDGFKAHIDKNCGGIFMASQVSQTIMSPMYPNGYPRYLNCNYTIVAPHRKAVIVEFENFDLETMPPSCWWANITISTSRYWRSMETSYCGNNKPPVITSTNKIVIIFRTYAHFSGNGFVFRYLSNDCGGELTEEGVISPPTTIDGSNYYGGLSCTWLITAPPDKSITVRFDALETEYSSRCFHDKIRIYEGPGLNATNLLSTYCGNLTENLPVTKSLGNVVTVNFASDHSDHFKGFRARIIFTKSIASGCGGSINLTSSHDWKTQKGAYYDNFDDCMWSIEAQPGKIIKMTFESFDVKNTENRTVLPQTAPCSGDYLEIRDGRGPKSELVGRYCGNVLPPSISSVRNLLWIRFYSDGENVGRGVTARLEPIDSPCGESVIRIENTTVTLKSPHYPENYPVGLQCKWILSGSNRRDLRIHFKNIDMENSENCQGDHLQLTDRRLNKHIEEGFGEDYIVNGKHQSNLRFVDSHRPVATYTFCANVDSFDYYSGGNIVEIALKSTNENSQKPRKFELEASLADCRNYTSPQGRIYHQGFNSCWSTITVPEGRTISLYFIRMRIYDQPGCPKNYLKVFDGDFNSPILGTYCSIQLPSPIFSTGNTLSLMLSAENNFSWQNYEITYTSTTEGRGCGGSIFNYAGKFTSPMFPNIYRNNSYCVWDVSVPRGSKVLLEFTTFDLGSRGMCDTSLSVEESTESGASITRYCEGEHPAKYRSLSNEVRITYTTTVNNGGTGWEIDFIAISEDYEETSNGPLVQLRPLMFVG